MITTESKCETIKHIFDNTKGDIRRHETLCYELGTKFESHHEMLMQIVDNIESLKNYTFLNDLHMEAYLPIQTATIAFEVS